MAAIFADNIFKCIFLNENVLISLKISLKFVPEVRINNIPALVQRMAWRWSGAKPLSEPMMVNFLKHICITLPQGVNPALSTLWLQMAWPGHQQPCYWPWSHGVFPVSAPEGILVTFSSTLLFSHYLFLLLLFYDLYWCISQFIKSSPSIYVIIM